MGIEIFQIGVSTALIVGQNSRLTDIVYDQKCSVCPARFFVPGKSHCSKISRSSGKATVTLIHDSAKSFAEKSARCTPTVTESRQPNLTLQTKTPTLV